MSTHHQLLYHIVFSTKGRKRLLSDSIRDEVFAYMSGICKSLEGFALEIGGFYDHVHLLVRIPAKTSVSEFVGKVKSNSSKHINESKSLKTTFSWQDGFGAFTVSQSQKDLVLDYIRNQMEHHKERSFQDEYLEFLKRHEVDFDERYVFD